MDEEIRDIVTEDYDDFDDEEGEQLPSSVVCTEHTSDNLRSYGILLGFGLIMVVTCVFSVITTEPGQTRMMLALGVPIGAVMAALAGYMLLVWKNRRVEVGQDGIVLTDVLGKEHAYTWDDVRIVDERVTSSGNVVFKTRDKREEPFAPSCGGFRTMCELLISMKKLRRVDEAALARKRKMKSLFDVVQGGNKREKVDESLYLPED